jgi:hypothetical protein
MDVQFRSLVMDDSGVATVVGDLNYQAAASRRVNVAAHAAWAPIDVLDSLDPVRTFEPAVVASTGGTVTASWSSDDGNLRTATNVPGSGWTAATTVALPGALYPKLFSRGSNETLAFSQTDVVAPGGFGRAPGPINMTARVGAVWTGAEQLPLGSSPQLLQDAGINRNGGVIVLVSRPSGLISLDAKLP